MNLNPLYIVRTVFLSGIFLVFWFPQKNPPFYKGSGPKGVTWISQKQTVVISGCWKGIQPLKSTRQDVDKIMGPATKVSRETATYENSGATVKVWYSTGPCRPSAGRWKVPAGVVVAIDVSPRQGLMLDDLQFDRTKFVRVQWTHPNNWYTYSFEDDGIEIVTIKTSSGTEAVNSITYLPKKKDDRLRCEESRSNN